jgi:hypothetical protein
LGGIPEAAGPPAQQHAGMNRNRHNIPRDETSRMVHSQSQSDTYSSLAHAARDPRAAGNRRLNRCGSVPPCGVAVRVLVLWIVVFSL